MSNDSIDIWLSNECNRLCAKAAGIPADARISFLKAEIQKLNASDVIKNALEIMVITTEVAVTESSERWVKPTLFIFGGAFLILIVVIAFFVPRPTPFQYTVFRVVLALAASGIGSALTGFLRIDLSYAGKRWLHAGGAFAMFVLVYLVNPAKLLIQ